MLHKSGTTLDVPDSNRVAEGNIRPGAQPATLVAWLLLCWARRNLMKIAVMGAGAVGGYFGARLAAAGSDVTFVARGSQLDAIRKDGLAVHSAAGDVLVHPARATDDPAEIGPVDVVIFTVKLWDTEHAARAIRPLIRAADGRETAVISFQNGVEKDDVLRSVLGAQHVIGGACYIGAVIERPGLIRHSGTMARLIFADDSGHAPNRSAAFLEACQAAGIDAQISTDIERAIWEKFVFLVGLSATTATARLPVGPIRSDAKTRALLLDIMREVVAVGRAKGVGLDEGYAENRLAFIDGLHADMTSSMHKDIERSSRLEVDWLSGSVVRLGQSLGVPTPNNRVIAAVLAPHAGGQPGRA